MQELTTKKEIIDYLTKSVNTEYEGIIYLKQKINNLIIHILSEKKWTEKTLKWIDKYKKDNNVDCISYTLFSAFVSKNCNYRDFI